MRRRVLLVGHGLMLVILLVSAPALAQITTGTVSGNVKDAQGGVIPGAPVVLISETRGTKSAPAATNESGDYVFPNVTPDTYAVDITLEGFKTFRRSRSNRAPSPKPLPSSDNPRSFRHRAASDRWRSRAIRSRTCRSRAGISPASRPSPPGWCREARRPAEPVSAARV